MKRGKTPTRAVRSYSPDDHISISQLVTLLADRDRRAHDTDRVRKARMRQHIMYAAYNGQLTEAIYKSEKCYVYGRAVAWAQAKWPGRYSDLVAMRDPIVASARGSLPRLVGRASAFQLPTTLSECQSELVEARRQIFAIEEQLTVARADAERLRPVADSWQRQVEANTQNAQQPRTRR